MKRELFQNRAARGSNCSGDTRPWDETNLQNLIFDPYQKRMDEIEARLESIEALLREKVDASVGKDEEQLQRRKSTRKRGPAVTIPIEHLVIRRDRLVHFLEFYWPFLGRLLAQPQNGTAILLALQKCVNSPNSSLVPTAEELLQHSTSLLQFLWSSDYSGDPRQIANAMAGIPEYSWSTSLKKCRNHPSTMAIGEVAMRDYLRRKCPAALAKLLNAKSPDDAARIMKAVRTDDRELLWLASHPEYLLRLLERGQPRKSL